MRRNSDFGETWEFPCAQVMTWFITRKPRDNTQTDDFFDKPNISSGPADWMIAPAGCATYASRAFEDEVTCACTPSGDFSLLIVIHTIYRLSVPKHSNWSVSMVTTHPPAHSLNQ